MRKTLAENARLAAAIVLVGVLVFSSLSFLLPNQRWTVFSTTSMARTDSTQFDLGNEVLDPAVNYLYSNYNATTGLNYNSPDTTDLQNTYWVYSDNYLVSLVLGTYDPGNTSLTSRAENIWEKMEYHLVNNSITNPMNQYMVLNQTVNYTHGSDPSGTLLEVDDGAVIKTHINNLPNIHPTAENYSDIAFLQVVYHYKLNEWGEAMTAYNCGIANWDGKGFTDKAFNDSGIDEYQTYKLALYIYASKLLGLVYDEQAFNTLLAMQQPDGGFKTGYDSNLVARGCTNMETTSLAVLALLAAMQAPIPEFGMMPLVVMGMLAAIVLMMGTRRRKSL